MTYTQHRAVTTHKAPPGRPRAASSFDDDGMDPETRRRRVRWWVSGGILVSSALVAFGGWAVATTPPPDVTREVSPGDSTAGGLGVDVTGVRCGVTSVGPSGLEQRAAGQFCLVDVKVTNNGREPVLFDSGAQRVHDTNGEAYAVAEQAAVFLNDHASTLLNEIRPGETVAGVLPFDMPSDARPGEVVLSDGITTPGVRLTLPDPR